MGAGPETPQPSLTRHLPRLSSQSRVHTRSAACRAGRGRGVSWVGPTGAGSRDLGLPDYRGSTLSRAGLGRGRSLWVVGALLTPPLAPPHCGV